MRKNILFTATLFVILISNPLFAQSDPGNDPNVPVDGGISALLAAGAIYGMKKIKETRKK